MICCLESYQSCENVSNAVSQSIFFENPIGYLIIGYNDLGMIEHVFRVSWIEIGSKDIGL